MATLSVSLTIPDAHATAIKSDFAAYLGWTANITVNGESVSNPETQNAFIKRKIGEYIKECVKAHRANNEQKAARDTSIADTDSTVVIS